MTVLDYLSECIRTTIKAIVGLILLNLGIALAVGLLVFLVNLFN